MADATAVSVDQPPSQTADYDCGLSVPPFDADFFSQDLIDNAGGALGDDLDFDYSFDDLYLNFDDGIDGLLNPEKIIGFDSQPGQNASFPQFEPNADQFNAVYKSTSELCHISGEGDFIGDRSSNGSGGLNSTSPVLEPHHISGHLNVPSPESKGSNGGNSDNCGGDTKGLNCASPESRGSGNCGSNVSEHSNNCVTRSVSSSPNSIRVGAVNQLKSEEPPKNKVKTSVLKRKKDSDDLPNKTVESRINKYRKSNLNSEDSNKNENDDNGGISEEDEKRKARLIRNRESAQLSRQRKKHYVDELEDKVKMMHSTIQDLNTKISYFMAENATLRQQMVGGAVPQPPPPVAAQPPPGMYPHPAMMYPWNPYAPPYMMKPHGSQVPLLPIPRLPQQPAQVPKVSKKVESKKKDRPKTKKVAGVSFLGLLFFVMLFGGLAPLVNMRYGGVRETLMGGGESYVGGGFHENHRGRVLMLNGTGTGNGVKDGVKSDFSSESSIHCGRVGHDSGAKPNADDFGGLGNGSEPLVASLYVPRNDKMVKIDGNLIIHSVLASEKSMSSNRMGSGETGLAVPGDLSLPVPGVGNNGARHPHLRALGSGSADKDSRQPKATDGVLQQWFREGLSGPMLSSGMCSEVFQFEVSPGAIIPASTSRNTSEQKQNSTRLSKGMNRRILRGLPIPLPQSSYNISRQHAGTNSQNKNLNGNNSVSPPMVVSVLVDPREAGDADVDGVMGGTKSLSRIFVVVLVDSVKYVTYSCMLPFKGSAPHLVTN
ncbi:hypothetical protein ABFX02_11G015200 [Erythranthe guttata]